MTPATEPISSTPDLRTRIGQLWRAHVTWTLGLISGGDQRDLSKGRVHLQK
jgi:hypothetical protein